MLLRSSSLFFYRNNNYYYNYDYIFIVIIITFLYTMFSWTNQTQLLFFIFRFMGITEFCRLYFVNWKSSFRNKYLFLILWRYEAIKVKLHYVKYVRIRVSSNPYIPIWGQNLLFWSYAGIYGSEETRILRCLT